MKLTTNIKTGEKLQLTSWKSPSDPSIGRFSGGVDPSNVPEVCIWKDNKPLWRSGPWDGRVFLGIPNMSSVYLNGYNLVVDNQEGIASYSFSFSNNSMLFHVLNSEGILEVRDLIPGKKNWEVIYLLPTNVCDAYGTCGAFASCDSLKKPICSCLRGFEPKNIEEWGRGNWTSGCVRRSPLQCERNNKTGEVGKEDGFLKQEKVKLPDFAEWSSIPQHKCREQCLNNCSCIAYAFHVGIGCMTWGGNLIDIAKMSSGVGDLYIRVSHSELGKKDLKVIVIVIVIVLVGSIAVAICTFFFWKWKAKHKASKNKNKLVGIDQGTAEFSSENIDLVKFQDLPLFNFRKLATATNNFHSNNKLGQGGFGPVYKGILEDGQEIEVKRLSKSSGQGLEEFMNKVMLISKLQHRNLVRLFGCCVEGEGKMLIYEHMPNKGLDAFLFDPHKHELLDWRKLFNIIEGICRGLLYLHRDSRLRIIYKDLKASNILLDKVLNAKISDFGMARIFKGNQDQDNTARIVGTYFGVLLLEIVSGRRNTSFSHDENCLTLLGFAWKLWNENNIVTLIDSAISSPCSHLEIIRCIHVGLLCVQEFAKDRPTVSTIISMLGSEIVDLPAPKQPAFTARQNALDAESSEQGQRRCSINNVTITVIDGR